MNNILQKIYDIHDIECNQKYDGNLPYSFHLKMVVNQIEKYSHTVSSRYNSIDRKRLFTSFDSLKADLTLAGGGHDLIEDARLTYNNVLELTNSPFVTDIIRCCTTPDIAGRNREERHSKLFFERLSEERWAVFVKLCDILANVIYSCLTNSRMYNIYREEFSELYSKLYVYGEFEDIWKDLKMYLKIWET